MEASALRHSSRAPLLAGISPYLRLQRDERLVALARRGHQGAFEALVRRYHARLLAFCKGMLGSAEDAEDVLQEVLAAAYKAMLADERPINARPWLYRIARNRCLNHLRGTRAAGLDSMDVFERDGGTTTADTVQHREDLRLIVADVQRLPESQRTALLLREMESLSYDQIALAMDTTVPAVKSLLVRARVSLAEANEARSLTCDEVRLELGRVEEGLAKLSAPVRRHVKSCERCHGFRGELRRTSRALAAAYPVPLLLLVKNLVAGKLIGGAAGSGGVAAAGGGGGAAGAVSAALAPVAAKGAAGLAATALLTAGAIEVDKLSQRDSDGARAAVPAAPADREQASTAGTTRSEAAERQPATAPGDGGERRHDTIAPERRQRDRDRDRAGRRDREGHGPGGAAAPVDPYTGQPVGLAPEPAPETQLPQTEQGGAADPAAAPADGQSPQDPAELVRELSPAGGG